ncbi:MAG: efflux RND transporter periplasmic adaptor subunit [Akkermansiaceae bacterium]|jgi:membrane fusion protein, heavy metal efflux system|nr:efflux RND transporter periplasmic adaptor subunit [Akkermansiaceae bacterium]
MKKSFHLILPCLFIAHLHAEEAIDPERAANTIILTESGVKNLRIELIEAEERTFNNMVFAIGRVEDVPGRGYAISSRIPGRAIKVNARIGDRVKQGETLVEVESRQPGSPPPVIPLKAIRDGIVTEANVIEGKPVSPDDALLTIADRSLMWVSAEIPEQRAAGIKEGTKAEVTFPALGGEAITATLMRFGIEADASAGSVHGIFELPNPTGRLSPGMRAELNIIVSARQDVMAVPEESIQGNPSSRVVYVKDFELENSYVKAPVVVGVSSGGWVEILEGLFPGDEVVTRGSYALGYAGGGGGVSLKEALDAAHGHKHNEDGSEMTPEQQAAEEKAHGDGHSGEGGGAPKWMIYYAAGITLAFLVAIQQLLNKRRKEGQSHA